MIGEDDASFSFLMNRQQHMQFKHYATICYGLWLGVQTNTSLQKTLHGNIFGICCTTQVLLSLIIVHIFNVSKSVGEHNIYFQQFLMTYIPKDNYVMRILYLYIQYKSNPQQ